MEIYNELQEAQGIKGVEHKAPSDTKQDFSTKVGGRKVTAFEDMMNVTSMFGAIGDKHTIDDNFDTGGASALLASSDEVMQDYKETESGYITPDGIPVSEDEWQQIYNTRAEERLLELKNKPMTDELYYKAVEDLPNEVIAQLGTDGPLTSQYDFAKRLYYIQEKEREKHHIAQDAEFLDYVGAFIGALTDVDSLATMGAGSVFKATKTGTKLFKVAEQHKIASGALMGASQAILSQYGYDLVSGTEASDKTYKYTALFGGVLGTTVGWLSSMKARKLEGSRYQYTKEDETTETLTKQEVLEKQISVKERELADLEDLEKNHLETHAELKTTSDSIKADEKAFGKKVKTIEDVRAREEALASEGHLNNAVELTEQMTVQHKKLVKPLVKTITKAKQTIAKAEEKLKRGMAHNKAREDYEVAIGKVEEARKEVKTLKANLKKLEKAYKKSVVAYEKGATPEGLKNLEKQKELIAKVKEKLVTNKKVSEETPKYVRPKKDLEKHKATIKNTSEELKQHTKDLNEFNKLHKKEIDGVIADVDKKVVESNRTVRKLNKKLQSLGFEYKDIKAKQEKVKAELKELKEGKLDTKELKKEVLTAKQKIEQELEEYLANPITTDKLEDNPSFVGHSRGWLYKLAISPITKLHESPNPYLRSLATVLAPPVVDKEHFVGNMTAKAMAHEEQQNAQKLLHQIDSEYKDYVTNGGKDYTKEQWEHEVEYQRALAIGKQQKEAREQIDSASLTAEEMAIKVQEVEENLAYKFSHEIPQLQRSMELTEKYYSSMATKGKTLGLTGLQNAKTGYVSQLYSERKALEMGEEAFVKHLTDAQTRFAIDMKMDITEELLAEFKAKATKAYTSALSENQRYDKMFRDFGPTTGPSSTSRLKERSIRMYADDMALVMDEKASLNTLVYGRSMGGKFAIKKFLGAENTNEIVERLSKIPNLKEEDMKNLKAVIDTIGGYREAMKYADTLEKALHGASTIVSMLHTLGFGIASATEISNIVATTGFMNTLRNIVPSFKMTMKAYKGKLTEEDYIHMSILSDIGMGKFSTSVNRYDIEGSVDTTGWLQTKMDNAVQKEAQLSGLTLFTDWFKVTAQMASHDFIARASKDISKISKADRMRLQTIGINDETLLQLNKIMWQDGKFQGLNKHLWGDELNEIVERATKQQVFSSILHPDGTTLPRVMTDGSSSKTRILNDTVFKFLKFPVASYEALLLKGMNNFDAKVAVGTALNASMWAGIILAKDKLNNPDSPKYDLESDEGHAKLLKDVLLNLSITSGAMVGANFVSAGLTGESISGYDKDIGSSVTSSDIRRTINGDIPLTVGPFKVMKVLEQLGIVSSTYEHKGSYKKTYSLKGLEGEE